MGGDSHCPVDTPIKETSLLNNPVFMSSIKSISEIAANDVFNIYNADIQSYNISDNNIRFYLEHKTEIDSNRELQGKLGFGIRYK